MSALDEVLFQTTLGPPQEEVQLVTAPDITVPDCQQILRDTEYGFNLERWVLSGQQPPPPVPSCPHYWLMFSSPQEGHRAGLRGGDSWALGSRPRSRSLNSADARWQHHRSVKFHVSDSEDEDGYNEDNEGSSTEDPPIRPINCSTPKEPPSRFKDTPPQNLRGAALSLQDGRRPLQDSPHLSGRKNMKKRQRSLTSMGRKTPPAALSPCWQHQHQHQQKQQQRPSSAGPAVKHRRQALRSGGSRGLFFDSAAELLSALSQEERELLESVTERGYPLRTAILALQKTGYHSPEKILKYLKASERLCELGYDEAQVEEALEMFQNCESKAAEFLRLLAQFNEMGFQQSAIKEVLLVHGNHRERALEELMTRMA